MLDPTTLPDAELTALWAALVAMVTDNHAEQDGLTAAEWAAADRLNDRLTREVERRNPPTSKEQVTMYRILKSHDDQGRTVYRVLGPKSEAACDYDGGGDAVLDDKAGLLDALAVVVGHTGPFDRFTVIVEKE